MMNEKMSEAEQMALMMSLWREMDEMKKKNEEEILALRRENEEMKRKLIGEDPSAGRPNPWEDLTQLQLAQRRLRSRSSLVLRRL